MTTSLYDRLSPLQRQRVDSEAAKTLREVFEAAHDAVGWCGDVMDECWGA